MDIDITSLLRDRFGDTPELNDELLALVLAGRKTATCGAYTPNGLGVPHVGMLSVIEDSEGRARCVIETLQVDITRFCDVTAEFARMEGEGDLSLEYWQDAHRAYFTRNGGFAEDMPLYCEIFRVVQVVGFD